MAGDTAVAAVILSRPVAVATLSHLAEATTADPVAVGRRARAAVRHTGTKTAGPNWR